VSTRVPFFPEKEAKTVVLLRKFDTQISAQNERQGWGWAVAVREGKIMQIINRHYGAFSTTPSKKVLIICRSSFLTSSGTIAMKLG
jgi:hypothetical protein